MSLEENKALVRREQAELWNHTGNLDAAAELFAPDRVEDAKQEAANVRRGFPDLESTIEDLIAERDKVVAHWRAQATHRGEYMGIPPTGNRVDFRGISIYRIEGGQSFAPLLIALFIQVPAMEILQSSHTRSSRKLVAKARDLKDVYQNVYTRLTMPNAGGLT